MTIRDRAFHYKRFIESNFTIVDKLGHEVPFILNKQQDPWLLQDTIFNDNILKPRQEGFSSLIEALIATNMLMVPNTEAVIVADIESNAIKLLGKVKHYIRSWEEKNKKKFTLSYNSEEKISSSVMNSTVTAGTEKNVNFGRSRTITMFHGSEVAFWRNIEEMIAGAGNALVDGGMFFIETTANGFNKYKKLWGDCELGKRSYKPIFYRASDFYSPEFLAKKKADNDKLFNQEYPESAIEAFLTSGDCYFDIASLKAMYKRVEELKPMTDGNLVLDYA